MFVTDNLKSLYIQIVAEDLKVRYIQPTRSPSHIVFDV